MKAAIPMPTVEAAGSLRLHSSETSAPRALPRVEKHRHKGAALHSSPIAGSADVLSLNLTRGCAHACAFCPASNPGDGVIHLFTDTVERISEELAARNPKPRAVFIGPATDPFPPLAEVQAETARVVGTLAAHGVGSWLMTRGFIRPAARHVLEAHRDQVKVTFGLTTLNRDLQRVLEPLAAPPRLRVKQIAHLREQGIAVQVAVEPLVPGLTDTRENLEELLESLAAVGVRHVTAGYVFLRAGIRDSVARALEPRGWDEMVLAPYRDGPILPNGKAPPARYLPKARRQRGYATLMALAAGLGMTVSVSGLTNPDFRTPRPVATATSLRQLMLPMF